MSIFFIGEYLSNRIAENLKKISLKDGVEQQAEGEKNSTKNNIEQQSADIYNEYKELSMRSVVKRKENEEIKEKKENEVPRELLYCYPGYEETLEKSKTKLVKTKIELVKKEEKSENFKETQQQKSWLSIFGINI